MNSLMISSYQDRAFFNIFPILFKCNRPISIKHNIIIFWPYFWNYRYAYGYILNDVRHRGSTAVSNGASQLCRSWIETFCPGFFRPVYLYIARVWTPHTLYRAEGVCPKLWGDSCESCDLHPCDSHGWVTVWNPRPTVVPLSYRRPLSVHFLTRWGRVGVALEESVCPVYVKLFSLPLPGISPKLDCSLICYFLLSPQARLCLEYW